MFIHTYEHRGRKQMVGARARTTRVRTIVRLSYPTPPLLKELKRGRSGGQRQKPKLSLVRGFESRCLADGRCPSTRIQTSLLDSKEQTRRGRTGGPCTRSTHFSRLHAHTPTARRHQYASCLREIKPGRVRTLLRPNRSEIHTLSLLALNFSWDQNPQTCLHGRFITVASPHSMTSH